MIEGFIIKVCKDIKVKFKKTCYLNNCNYLKLICCYLAKKIQIMALVSMKNVLLCAMPIVVQNGQILDFSTLILHPPIEDFMTISLCYVNVNN